MFDTKIKLAFEKINDQYSKAKYLGTECIMDMKTGYINATKFCSTIGDKTKRFDHYIANSRYENLSRIFWSKTLNPSNNRC